jgi:hypothetical protein
VHQILADSLVIDSNSENVSQAIALGNDNMVSVQVEITAATSGGSFGSGFTFTVQGSNDLENWSTDGISSLLEATTYEAPSITHLPQYQGAGTIAYPFVRLRYTNNEPIAILVRSSIHTSKASA